MESKPPSKFFQASIRDPDSLKEFVSVFSVISSKRKKFSIQIKFSQEGITLANKYEENNTEYFTGFLRKNLFDKYAFGRRIFCIFYEDYLLRKPSISLETKN